MFGKNVIINENKIHIDLYVDPMKNDVFVRIKPDSDSFTINAISRESHGMILSSMKMRHFIPLV